MKISLVLNRGAGMLRGRDAARTAAELSDVFRQHGHNVDVSLEEGPATVAAIARICGRGSSDVVVVGGGDGTVSAAAAAVAESGLALGVLPLGTMNLFARSLRVPLRMQAAASALAAGTPGKVDIGEVNGRLFVHHVTLGLHPRIIRMRERLNYRSAFGKVWATTQAWWAVLGRPPRLQARIVLDDAQFERGTVAILVSNNPFGDGHIPYADDLNQGKLGIYVLRSHRWHDLVRLTGQITFGEFSANPLLERWLSERAEVSLPAEETVASVDGEIVTLKTPLRLRIRRGGLAVLRPGLVEAAAAVPSPAA